MIYALGLLALSMFLSIGGGTIAFMARNRRDLPIIRLYNESHGDSSLDNPAFVAGMAMVGVGVFLLLAGLYILSQQD